MTSWQKIKYQFFSVELFITLHSTSYVTAKINQTSLWLEVEKCYKTHHNHLASLMYKTQTWSYTMNLMKTLFHWQIAGVGCTVMVPGESSSAPASRRSTAAGPTAAGPSRPALHSMIFSSISLPSRQKAQVMNIPVLHFDSPVCWLNTVTVDSLFYSVCDYYLFSISASLHQIMRIYK